MTTIRKKNDETLQSCHMKNKKLLHPYEQGMLLSAMLFDRKNLSDIMNFFPEEQVEHMNTAKQKFMALQRDERMTQIVLELRRLLLINEYRIDRIHKSWIDSALAKEPVYLRSIILKSIAKQTTQEVRTNHQNPIIPLSLIFYAFISQFAKTRQKIAIFDPVLMRLQSLNDALQEKTLISIGVISIDALAQVVNSKRLMNFLRKKKINISSPTNCITKENNPFLDTNIRRRFLNELICFKPCPANNGLIYAGVIMVALYLTTHKYQWQSTIALGFNVKFGQLIGSLIKKSTKLSIDKEKLSRFLLLAFDQIK
jgi:hypothetical protein